MFKRLISKVSHAIESTKSGNTPANLVNRQLEETGQVLLNTAGMTEFCRNPKASGLLTAVALS
jgi:hypothetical protein